VTELTIPGFSEVGKVGSGGLGDVYRATRLSTGAVSAVKLLRSTGERADSDRRVRREVAALVALRGHPNVVQIEEVVELPEGLAIVMEFVPGGSLRDLLRRHGPLGPERALHVMKDVLSALVAAHELGIVHRDIKPHNVMIGRYGQHKVCDFGIAGALDAFTSSEHTQAFSERYASPEEITGSSRVGPAADVYSLGVTIRQVLTGETTPAKAATAMRAQLDAGRWRGAELEALKRVYRLSARLTAVEPTNRPTASSALAEVEQIAAGLRSQAAVDAGVLTMRSPESAATGLAPVAAERVMVSAPAHTDLTVCAGSPTNPMPLSHSPGWSGPSAWSPAMPPDPRPSGEPDGDPRVSQGRYVASFSPAAHLAAPSAAATHWSALAIVSFVLGVLWLFGIGSIAAVVVGWLALRETKVDSTLRGRGLAVAGLTLGVVGGLFMAASLMVATLK